MNVGRTAYYNYYTGGSCRRFEELLLLNEMNGADMGNINHSKGFSQRLRPHVAVVVRERINKFISTELVSKCINKLR